MVSLYTTVSKENVGDVTFGTLYLKRQGTE